MDQKAPSSAKKRKREKPKQEKSTPSKEAAAPDAPLSASTTGNGKQKQQRVASTAQKTPPPKAVGKRQPTVAPEQMESTPQKKPRTKLQTITKLCSHACQTLQFALALLPSNTPESAKSNKTGNREKALEYYKKMQDYYKKSFDKEPLQLDGTVGKDNDVSEEQRDQVRVWINCSLVAVPLLVKAMDHEAEELLQRLATEFPALCVPSGLERDQQLAELVVGLKTRALIASAKDDKLDADALDRLLPSGVRRLGLSDASTHADWTDAFEKPLLTMQRNRRKQLSKMSASEADTKYPLNEVQAMLKRVLSRIVTWLDQSQRAASSTETSTPSSKAAAPDTTAEPASTTNGPSIEKEPEAAKPTKKKAKSKATTAPEASVQKPVAADEQPVSTMPETPKQPEKGKKKAAKKQPKQVETPVAAEPTVAAEPVVAEVEGDRSMNGVEAQQMLADLTMFGADDSMMLPASDNEANMSISTLQDKKTEKKKEKKRALKHRRFAEIMTKQDPTTDWQASVRAADAVANMPQLLDAFINTKLKINKLQEMLKTEKKASSKSASMRLAMEMASDMEKQAAQSILAAANAISAAAAQPEVALTSSSTQQEATTTPVTPAPASSEKKKRTKKSPAAKQDTPIEPPSSTSTAETAGSSDELAATTAADTPTDKPRRFYNVWSTDELNALEEGLTKYQNSWRRIATDPRLTNRTNSQIKDKTRTLYNNCIRDGRSPGIYIWGASRNIISEHFGTDKS